MTNMAKRMTMTRVIIVKNMIIGMETTIRIMMTTVIMEITMNNESHNDDSNNKNRNNDINNNHNDKPKHAGN